MQPSFEQPRNNSDMGKARELSIGLNIHLTLNQMVQGFSGGVRVYVT